MLAVVKESRGEGQVAYRDVPDPTPGKGQAKIKVHYAGICGSDIHIYHDRIGLRLNPPVVMGHEFVGTIVDIGSGVSSWSAGDRVVSETAFRVCGRCLMCRSGHDNVCPEKELIGYVHNGAFAEWLIVPVERLHRPPSGVPDETVVMSEPLAGCIHGMIEQCTVQAGDLVVLMGPGTVGLISLQIAKLLGARTVMCGQSVHRLALAATLGANHVVDLSADDPAEVVQSLSDGAGCDVFVECAGSAEAVSLGLRLLRRRGRFLQQGLLSQPASVAFDDIAYKELVVTGTMGQKWTAWERAMDLLGSDAVKLQPLVSHVPTRLPIGRVPLKRSNNERPRKSY